MTENNNVKITHPVLLASEHAREIRRYKRMEEVDNDEYEPTLKGSDSK
jgi:hypothetical protein